MIAIALTAAWLAAAPQADPAPAGPVDAPAAAPADPGATALDAATARIQKGKSQPAQLVAAWADKAAAYAVLGDPDKAARAYSVVLRIDPSHRLPDAADPAITAAFAAALTGLPAPDRALSAAALRRDGRVVVRLLADDLALVHAARLDDGPAAPLTPAAPAVALDGADGGARVALLDKHGNALRVLYVVDETPAGATVATGGDGPRWLVIAGASTMALGTAGVVVTGVGFSTIGIDDTQRSWLLAGIGVATGVALLGGGLVVADLLSQD